MFNNFSKKLLSKGANTGYNIRSMEIKSVKLLRNRLKIFNNQPKEIICLSSKGKIIPQMIYNPSKQIFDVLSNMSSQLFSCNMYIKKGQFIEITKEIKRDKRKLYILGVYKNEHLIYLSINDHYIPITDSLDTYFIPAHMGIHKDSIKLIDIIHML